MPHGIETELIERITPLVQDLVTSRARALAHLAHADVRLEVSGTDLADLGLAESPRVGEILAELRRRKLNGELDGRESELEAARELIGG